MSGHVGAPAIEVINLRSRSDRRAAMQGELARVGWQGSFYIAEKPADPGKFSSIGARGCFESHLAVLRRNVGAGWLVLLEDDVNFVNNFSDQWKDLERRLKDVEWSVCYAGHRLNSSARGLVRVDPHEPITSAHFVIFNGSAISEFATFLECIYAREAGDPRGGPMHVDGAYSTIRFQHPHLTTYAYFPSLGYQRSSRTDIGSLRWYDKVDLLRPLLNLARGAKSSIKRGTRGY